jgi:hypothetical protein
MRGHRVPAMGGEYVCLRHDTMWRMAIGTREARERMDCAQREMGMGFPMEGFSHPGYYCPRCNLFGHYRIERRMGGQD